MASFQLFRYSHHMTGSRMCYEAIVWASTTAKPSSLSHHPTIMHIIIMDYSTHSGRKPPWQSQNTPYRGYSTPTIPNQVTKAGLEAAEHLHAPPCARSHIYSETLHVGCPPNHLMHGHLIHKMPHHWTCCSSELPCGWLWSVRRGDWYCGTSHGWKMMSCSRKGFDFHMLAMLRTQLVHIQEE